MNNQSNRALILTITVLVTACISYTAGLQISSHHAATSAVPTPLTEVAPTAAKQYRLGQLSVVYDVCNYSRVSATTTENSCAALQDSTESEFLCQSANTDPSTYCWVEDESMPSSVTPLTFNGTN